MKHIYVYKKKSTVEYLNHERTGHIDIFTHRYIPVAQTHFKILNVVGPHWSNDITVS